MEKGVGSQKENQNREDLEFISVCRIFPMYTETSCFLGWGKKSASCLKDRDRQGGRKLLLQVQGPWACGWRSIGGHRHSMWQSRRPLSSPRSPIFHAQGSHCLELRYTCYSAPSYLTSTHLFLGPICFQYSDQVTAQKLPMAPHCL